MICMYSAGSPISQFVDSVSLTVSTTRANAIHCSWVSQFIRQARAHGSTWPKKNHAIQRTGWAFLTIYTMRGLRPVSLAWVDDSNCAGWILQRYLEDVVPSIFARNTTNSDTDPTSLCSIEIPTSSMIALQGLAGVYSLDVWWLPLILCVCVSKLPFLLPTVHEIRQKKSVENLSEHNKFVLPFSAVDQP